METNIKTIKKYNIREGDILHFDDKHGLVNVIKLETETIEKTKNVGSFLKPKKVIIAQEEELAKVWFRPVHENTRMCKVARAFVYDWDRMKNDATLLLDQMKVLKERNLL